LGFDDQKLEKFTVRFLLSKIAIYLFLGSVKNDQATGELFISQRKHLALKILKFLYFFGSFLPLLDPDPADQNECGSGFTTLIKRYDACLI
jgi:hypothetical protein